MSIGDRLQEAFYRVAASGFVPRRFFAPTLPNHRSGPPTDGSHHLEIVSHCWQYEKLLAYQLSSLVLHPPRSIRVRMTVFHSEDDPRTLQTLSFFGAMAVENVTWNWQRQEKTQLFRRAIGRNLAARTSPADWIWFTDCDVTFQRGSLDALADELCHCPALLAFPREHQVSDPLTPDDPIFRAADGPPAVLDLDLSRFRPEARRKAVGALQIVPGDIARAVGYCANIGYFQSPAPSFGSTWEDRTFRWLLGTHGTPLNTSGFFRIRHSVKGRHSHPMRWRSVERSG